MEAPKPELQRGPAVYAHFPQVLPLELQRRVYHELFSDGVRLVTWKHLDYIVPQHSAILRVCKEVFINAKDIFNARTCVWLSEESGNIQMSVQTHLPSWLPQVFVVLNSPKSISDLLSLKMSVNDLSRGRMKKVISFFDGEKTIRSQSCYPLLYKHPMISLVIVRNMILETDILIRKFQVWTLMSFGARGLDLSLLNSVGVYSCEPTTHPIPCVLIKPTYTTRDPASDIQHFKITFKEGYKLLDVSSWQNLTRCFGKPQDRHELFKQCHYGAFVNWTPNTRCPLMIELTDAITIHPM